MRSKQVEKSHYDFARYMTKQHWSSLWHQLDEVLALEPASVLEVGPGPGLFAELAARFGVAVETLDLDPELKPDHVGSATELPFEDATYDVTCAFQVLEHLPFEESLEAFAEMARVAQRHVIISLPDSARRWRYVFHLPRFGDKEVSIPAPALGPKEHDFDGQHYWELNKRGYGLDRVEAALESSAAVKLVRSFRVPDYAYHHYFVYRKTG